MVAIGVVTRIATDKLIINQILIFLIELLLNEITLYSLNLLNHKIQRIIVNDNYLHLQVNY